MDNCTACKRAVASLMPVQEGQATVCGCCCAVMVREQGTLRMATDEELEAPDVQRKLQLARWIRRLFPPKDVQ